MLLFSDPRRQDGEEGYIFSEGRLQQARINPVHQRKVLRRQLLQAALDGSKGLFRQLPATTQPLGEAEIFLRLACSN